MLLKSVDAKYINTCRLRKARIAVLTLIVVASAVSSLPI